MKKLILYAWLLIVASCALNHDKAMVSPCEGKTGPALVACEQQLMDAAKLAKPNSK